MGTYYNDNPLRSAGPLDGTLDLVSSPQPYKYELQARVPSGQRALDLNESKQELSEDSFEVIRSQGRTCLNLVMCDGVLIRLCSKVFSFCACFSGSFADSSNVKSCHMAGFA